MQIDEIKRLIEAGLEGSIVEIDGDGTHFNAVIVSAAFAGKSLVQQHQMVYRTLGDRMGRDIHALSMQTHTPDEWARIKQLKIR